MKSIRVGNDIVVRWRIYRYGKEYDVEQNKESISVILANMGEKKVITDYSVVDVNIIVFKFRAEDQGLGIYRLLLVDKSRNSTRVIEECNAFRIVSTASAADDVDTLESTVTITLTSELTAPADGLSAYEVALQNGFVGTEEEWLQSLLPDMTDIEQAEAQRQAKELERIASEEARESAESERQRASAVSVASANDAAASANAAASAANKAAVNANNKASLADEATYWAQMQGDAALDASLSAETQAMAAKKAADNANAAAENANTKAEEANNAAISANAAKETANAAAGSANDAAANAEQKATLATEAASSASTAAEAADTAAGRANEAADKFNAAIVQEKGDSQDKAMSQKAVTDALTASDQKLAELVESCGSIDKRLNYIEGGNLPDTYNYFIGCSIDNNGNIVRKSGYVVTDKISVINGHTITVTGKGSCRINLLDNNGEYFDYYSYVDARKISLNFNNIGYIQFNAEADFSELKVYDNTTSTTIYKNTITAGVDFKSKILKNESDIAQENNKLVSLADYGVNKLRNDSSVIEISVNEEKYYDANYIVKAGRTYYISNYTGRFVALRVVDYSGAIVETINKNVVAENCTHITFSHEGHLHLYCIPSSGNLKCAIVSGEDINNIAKYNNMLSDVLFSYTDCGDFEYGYYALQNMYSLPLAPSSDSQSLKYIVREVRKNDCLFIKASCISSIALGYALTDTERNIYEKDVLFAPFGTWLIAKKDGFICINSVLDGVPTPSLTIFTPKMNIATLSNSMIIKKKVYIGNDNESNVVLFDNLNIPVNTRISLLIEGDFEWTRLAVYANNDWNDAPDRIDNIVNGTLYHRAVNNIITNYRVYKITGSEVGYVTATLVIGDNTQFAYQGEKISIIPKVNWEMLAHSTNRSKMQDGDCYKNIYFQFHDLSSSEFFHGVEVFDLEKDGALIQSIELPVETDFHCNSVSFGPNKYADSDIFPLLYVCGFWGSPDIVVYRIGGTYGSYTLTEVQRIHLIGEHWVNAFVDSRGFIYTQKPHVENVTDTITKYELPLVSEGDVTLSTSIESFDIDVTDPFGYGTTNGEQGGTIHNGKLFLCFGFDNNRNRISVIDLIDKNICSNIGTLTSMGLDAEVQGCFIYKDKLGVSFNGSGQIIALSFE